MYPEFENPPWIDNSGDDSDDDEWLFNSMQRYKQIFKYSIVCDAASIDIHAGSRRLVIAGARSSWVGNKSNNKALYEIAVYSIPEKLVLESGEKEGLSNGRDLSLLAGIGLESSILKVAFLSSDLLVFVQKNTVSVWSIDSESDLLINLKKISLEFPLLFANLLIINENSVILGYPRNKQIQIEELDLKRSSGNEPELNESRSKNTKISCFPKNMIFEQFDEFNKNLIVALANDTSTIKNHLFFEPQLHDENSVTFHYLGGIQDATEDKSSEKELLTSCWRKTDKVNKRLLGAAIKMETNIESSRTLSLYVYYSESLEQNILKSHQCSQNMNINFSEELVGKDEINMSRNDISMQFVSASDTISLANCGGKELCGHTLLIKFKTKINLYQINIQASDNPDDNLPWRADCKLLFCHDAHKAPVRHALQYSARLPQLFLSVDENKDLHAWHWQKT